MSDSDNYLKILEKISEVREDVGVMKNEMGHLKSDISETREQLKSINEQDIEQNRLLDKHILGVRTAMERLDLERRTREEQIQKIHERLKETESIPNFLKMLKKTWKWIASLAIAIAAVIKLLKLF